MSNQATDQVERPTDWESNPPYTDDYQGQRFVYGLQYRPLSIGTVPKGAILGSYHADDNRLGARFGTIEYPFRLPPVEVRSFELTDYQEEQEQRDAFANALLVLEQGLVSRQFKGIGSPFERSVLSMESTVFSMISLDVVDLGKTCIVHLSGAHGKTIRQSADCSSTFELLVPRLFSWFDREIEKETERPTDESDYDF